MNCVCKEKDGKVVSLCGAHEEAFRIRRVWALNWLQDMQNGAHVQMVSLRRLIRELKAILKY